MKKTMKWTLSLVLAAALMSCGSLTAFAAESDAASYGYQKGQQQNMNRHSAYGELASLTTDADRQSFFEQHDIGGGLYSDAAHLDADALVEAGLVDQDTADRIESYASEWHAQISGRYSTDLAAMSPADRHTWYAGFAGERETDSLDRLTLAGIISAEQAEAIRGWMG